MRTPPSTPAREREGSTTTAAARDWQSFRRRDSGMSRGGGETCAWRHDRCYLIVHHTGEVDLHTSPMPPTVVGADHLTDRGIREAIRAHAIIAEHLEGPGAAELQGRLWDLTDRCPAWTSSDWRTAVDLLGGPLVIDMPRHEASIALRQ
jgi:hypothetical protein